MELEGISKACRLKVMMNSPTTSTRATEAMNSGVVSRFLSGFAESLLVFITGSFESYRTMRNVRFQRVSWNRWVTPYRKTESLPPQAPEASAAVRGVRSDQ